MSTGAIVTQECYGFMVLPRGIFLLGLVCPDAGKFAKHIHEQRLLRRSATMCKQNKTEA